MTVVSKQRAQKFRKLINHFIPILKLDNWELHATCDTDDGVAWNICKPEYMASRLNFNMSRIPEGEERDFVVHELLHCHVERLSQLAAVYAGDDPAKKEQVRMEEEYLTTMLERIICELHSQLSREV